VSPWNWRIDPIDPVETHGSLSGGGLASWLSVEEVSWYNPRRVGTNYSTLQLSWTSYDAPYCSDRNLHTCYGFLYLKPWLARIDMMCHVAGRCGGLASLWATVVITGHNRCATNASPRGASVHWVKSRQTPIPRGALLIIRSSVTDAIANRADRQFRSTVGGC